MSIQAASEYTTQFRIDVNDLFKILTLPRREFASMGETGFFDTADSFSFGDLVLKQIHKNLKYIIREHFEDGSEELIPIVDDVLGNYTHGGEEISITFYQEPFKPIGIEINKDFKESERTATISRDRVSNKFAFGESDSKMFDRLYGTYLRNRTDLYGDSTYSITLSIRNTKEYVDYSVRGSEYDNTVQDWVGEKPTSIFGVLRI